MPHGRRQGRDLERGPRPHAGRGDGRGHRPRDRPAGRRALGALRALPAPRRAARRRPRRGRRPDLRRCTAGTTASTPASARTTTPRRSRSSRAVLEGDDLFVDRDEVAALQDAPPAAVRPRRVPGLLPATRTWSRRSRSSTYIHELAANGLDQDRPPRSGRRDGRAARASCRRGTTSSSSPRSSRGCRCSTTSRSAPRCASGPNADKPLWLDIPIFVSDMSFGALSQEAKTALVAGRRARRHRHLLGRGRHAARGAGREQPLLLRARVGPLRLVVDVLKKVQAFHFKGGQGAKTGTGGHLPGHKVVGRIAEVRGLPEGTPRSRRRASPTGTRSTTSAASPTTVRERSGGIPIGFKLSAQHIEDDIDAALDDRRRLHHPRRPRRRHRRGAAAVPRQHLGADDPRARPGPRATSTGAGGATSRSSSPAACATRPTSPRRSRSAPTRSRSPTRRSRRSAASACGRATPTTARSASRPRSRTCGPGCPVDEAAAPARPLPAGDASS